MPQFRYLATEYRQVDGGPPVFLFSAPCHEVTGWAGIPRKEAKEGVQTLGFQRVNNTERLKKLRVFLEDRSNVIANPILCAVRTGSRIQFDPVATDEDTKTRVGWLRIDEPDYDRHPLLQLLKEVEDLLVRRLPRLAETQVPEEELADFLRSVEDLPQSDDTAETSEESAQEEGEDLEVAEGPSVAFSSESHLDNFFHAVRLRRLALERTGADDRDQFAGFSKAALKDYLHAATVVDGQHRLLGAQALLAEAIETEEARGVQDLLLEQGRGAEEVLRLVYRKYARHLGIALIHNDDWSEHVFQFVVVNQKAVQIPTALLGSIIATTLTDGEVERITQRLGRADIEVMDYRVIAFLEGSPESPFRGLIKRGYDERKEAENKLDWSVVDRLVRAFRVLQGTKYFHERPRPVDYAKRWRERGLPISKIVEDFTMRGFASPYVYWSDAKGPWLAVFCRVWSVVCNQLGTTDDPSALNYWGNPKTSNLFNDVHLSILAADFFNYLAAGRSIPLDSAEAATQVAMEWLDGAKKEYFARDYGLKGRGVKKSEGPVKVLWSSLWKSYRENGYRRLPSVNSFCP